MLEHEPRLLARAGILRAEESPGVRRPHQSARRQRHRCWYQPSVSPTCVHTCVTARMRPMPSPTGYPFTALCKATARSATGAMAHCECVSVWLWVCECVRGSAAPPGPRLRRKRAPPWRQPRGKSSVDLPQMPPDSGGICMGVD